MNWTAEELWWWVSLWLKEAETTPTPMAKRYALDKAKIRLEQFDAASKTYPNLRVQYDQLKRQYDSQRG